MPGCGAVSWPGCGGPMSTLPGRMIHVRRSSDFGAKVIVTSKSAADVRVVPITERLRELLIEHGLDNPAWGQ